MKNKQRIINRILALLLVTTLLCGDWHQSYFGSLVLQAQAWEGSTDGADVGTGESIFPEDSFSEEIVGEIPEPEIKSYEELAGELKTPFAIYNYLKNNLHYEPYSGLRKGPQGTLDGLAGNDVDQAALLVAMLNSQGYETEYVKGRIRMDGEDAMKLTGAEDIQSAGDLLSLGGEPAEILSVNGEPYAICMDHVWVEAKVPYGNYRGAGNAAGKEMWIPLDVSFKEYEATDAVYDHYEEWGLTEEVLTGVEDYGDVTKLYGQLETELASLLEGGEYFLVRHTIKEEELPYLPLSLPYDIIEETYRGQTPQEDWYDTIRLQIGEGETVTLRSADLYNQSLLIAYEETQGGLLGTFYAGDTALATGTWKTFGEEESLHLEVVSGGKTETIENTLKAGSLYSLTLDAQMITPAELIKSREELTEAARNVTEDNVFSKEYLGSFLDVAGKLYFAQLDIMDRMLAEQMKLGMVRSLSVGMTGYEVTSAPGEAITGSLFIDIDLNARTVAGGTREEAEQFFLTSGMISSALESGVWEELTGYYSVSTMTVFQTAREEGQELLFISNKNWDEQKTNLEATEDVVADIEAALNRGACVIVNPQEVTIGDWRGTGYQIMEADGITAQYRISGGHNGGAFSMWVDLAFLATLIVTAVDLGMLLVLVPVIAGMFFAGPIGIVAGVVVVCVLAWVCWLVMENYYKNWELWTKYHEEGDLEAGQQVLWNAVLDLALVVLVAGFGKLVKGIATYVLENPLVKELNEKILAMIRSWGDDFVKMARDAIRLTGYKYGDDVLYALGEKYGLKGYAWLLKKHRLGLSDDIIKKLIDTDNFMSLSDDFLKALNKSNGYADDMLKQVSKYKKEAEDAIAKYGDEAADLINKYEDDAVKGFKEGKTPDEVRKVCEGGRGTKPTQPTLPKGSIPKGQYAPENNAGLIGQNNAADKLADAGYDVEMLEEVNGGNGYGIKETANPDYLIDGNVFDCYTPEASTAPKKICSKIREKTIEQSDRIILNLENVSEGSVYSIKEYLLERTGDTRDLKRLNELIVILPNGNIETWFLR